MRASTVNDLASLVRSRRKDLGLTQAKLADKVGVKTLWVSQFERGKSTAQVGIVLRTLRVLNFTLNLNITPSLEETDVVDLNSILKSDRNA